MITQTQSAPDPEPPPLKDETIQAIMKLAKGKAAKPDEILIELIRYGGEPALDLMHTKTKENSKTFVQFTLTLQAKDIQKYTTFKNYNCFNNK